MPRPPKGGGPGKFVPPAYDSDYLLEYINQLEYDVAGLPDIVKKNLIADVKRELTLAVTPTRPSYDTQAGLLYGDIEETPGVQLKVSLNPQDWAEDPGEQARKTLKGWGSSFFEWDDFRNWVERRYFWEPALRGNGTFTPGGEAPLSAGLDSLVQGMMAAGGAGTTDAPLQMSGLGIKGKAFWLDEYNLMADNFAYYEDSSGNLILDRQGNPIKILDDKGNPVLDKSKKILAAEYDVYESAGQKFLDFADNVESAAGRNRAYNELRLSSASAIKEELDRYVKGVEIRDAAGNVIQTLKITDTGALKEIGAFGMGVDVVREMQTFRAGPTGKSGISNAVTGLSKIIMEGDRAVDELHNPLSTERVLDDLMGHVHKRETDPITGRVRNSGARAKLEEIRDSIKGDSQLLAAFNSNKNIAGFERMVDSVEKAITDFRSNPANLTNPIALRSLYGELNAISNQFSTTGYFKKGLENDLLDELVNGAVLRGKGIFDSKGGLKGILDSTAAQARAAGRKTGFDNVQRVLKIGNNMYDRNDVKDLVDQIEGGKLIQNYVWTRIKTRVNAFTPAYHVREYLNRVHYFGLKYDPIYMEQNLRRNGVLSVRDPATGKFVPVKGAYFSDYSHYDRFARFMPKNTFSIETLSGNMLKVQGGKHFTSASNIYKEFKKLDQRAGAAAGAKKLGAILDPKTGKLLGFQKIGAPGSETYEILQLLNLNPNVVFGIGGLVAGNAESVANMKANIVLFRMWMYKNRAELGLKFQGSRLIEIGKEGEENAKALTKLFQQLGRRIDSNDFIDITWERVGHLQKLSSYVNQLQTKVFGKLGKFLSPYVQLKNTISHVLTQVIIQGLAAVSAGAGELLEFLEPVIKFIVNFVINKVEAVFKGVFLAIFKGDVGGALADFSKSMEKFVGATVKIASYVAIIPALMFIVVFMLFAVVITALNPADPTRTGGLAGSIDRFGEGTPGTYDGCSADSYVGQGDGVGSVPADCFSFEGASTSVPAGMYTGTLIDWPAGNLSSFQAAIEVLSQRSGDYINRLCSGGKINLLRSSMVPGWCGNVITRDTIVFTSLCTYGVQNYLNYLFAHETGHVYMSRFGSADLTSAIAAEGTFPTYPGNCGFNNTLNEDFAETIGNWVQVNACDCPGVATYGPDWSTWWDYFTAHKTWAEGFF